MARPVCPVCKSEITSGRIKWSHFWEPLATFRCTTCATMLRWRMVWKAWLLAIAVALILAPGFMPQRWDYVYGPYMTIFTYAGHFVAAISVLLPSQAEKVSDE